MGQDPREVQTPPGQDPTLAALDARVAVMRRRILRALQLLALASGCALLEAGALALANVAPALQPLVEWALEATGAECPGPDCDDGTEGPSQPDQGALETRLDTGASSP